MLDINIRSAMPAAATCSDLTPGGLLLNYFEAIRGLLDVLVASDEVHVLAIESAPGLGKSSTIEAALQVMEASVE